MTKKEIKKAVRIIKEDLKQGYGCPLKEASERLRTAAQFVR